jgi:hypothetical protein
LIPIVSVSFVCATKVVKIIAEICRFRLFSYSFKQKIRSYWILNIHIFFILLIPYMRFLLGDKTKSNMRDSWKAGDEFFFFSIQGNLPKSYFGGLKQYHLSPLCDASLWLIVIDLARLIRDGKVSRRAQQQQQMEIRAADTALNAFSRKRTRVSLI